MVVFTLLSLSGFVWWLLYPHFNGALAPVLGLYIVSILSQFVVAMFSHDRFIPLGGALYVVSDSFIGLHRWEGGWFKWLP